MKSKIAFVVICLSLCIGLSLWMRSLPYTYTEGKSLVREGIVISSEKTEEDGGMFWVTMKRRLTDDLPPFIGLSTRKREPGEKVQFCLRGKPAYSGGENYIPIVLEEDVARPEPSATGS